jgi:hypothetical protein
VLTSRQSVYSSVVVPKKPERHGSTERHDDLSR